MNDYGKLYVQWLVNILVLTMAYNFFFLVPFIMYNTDQKLVCPPGYNAALCDVATTILDVMGISQASEMSGRSLLAQ